MSPKRVLVVDDAMIMRARIKLIATKAGWEVFEAVDGEEAIRKYQECSPDLVTMDIVMPNKDGVAALDELMKMDASANVVMVTAVNQKEKLNECIQLGAMDFIVKPFDPCDLEKFFTKYVDSESKN